MDKAEIETRFTYHPPKGDQGQKYELLRNEAKRFALLIDEVLPDSREKSEALTCLESAVMYANAGIARRT